MRSNVETTGWVKNVTIDQSFFEKKGRRRPPRRHNHNHPALAARSHRPIESAMGNACTRPRIDPSEREPPRGDDSAPSVGVVAARVGELEKLLKATRSELDAAKATIAAHAETQTPPTFDANEQLASVVLSHVTDVRTRVALAQVNTAWRKASKFASSLPASLDFTGCPVKLNEANTWNTTCDYVLGIEGVLDLPDSHVHGLLAQAGADLTTPLRQCNLGVFYGSAERYDKALEWYMKGARQGNRVCENNLGLFYKNGRGVERNIDTALKWFTKSAKKGDADAQCEAGAIHYIKGRHEEAVKWYKKAAAQGEMCAQSNLGNCYERGEGVKKDIPEALKWCGKAAEQGNAEAAKNILRLAKAMQVE